MTDQPAELSSATLVRAAGTHAPPKGSWTGVEPVQGEHLTIRRMPSEIREMVGELPVSWFTWRRKDVDDKTVVYERG